MLYSLKPQYWAGAKWVMNRSTMQTIATFKDSGGRYVLNPVTAPGAPPNLLGYDVVIAEDMPAVAANTFAIAFGDWRRAYTVADRKGMTIIVDRLTNKPYVGITRLVEQAAPFEL